MNTNGIVYNQSKLQQKSLSEILFDSGAQLSAQNFLIHVQPSLNHEGPKGLTPRLSGWTR